MMISLEEIWRALEAENELGGAQRVDVDDANDFFCYLDAVGRRGLLLITDDEPPPPLPTFGAVDLRVGRRADGRWSMLVVLKLSALTELFALLCQDLIQSVRGVDRELVSRSVITRLLRWRRLLEAGDTGVLAVTELRGLFGELKVLQCCLKQWAAPEVIEAWVGPLDAPQDFVLPSLRIEVKTVVPSATRTIISSVDQLDVPADTHLLLAVVQLASVPAESPAGDSPAKLVGQIRDAIDQYPSAAIEFDSRLISAGYVDNEWYDTLRFRLDSLRYYAVTSEFPRITRSMLPVGVADAIYEIGLAACAAFESPLKG